MQKMILFVFAMIVCLSAAPISMEKGQLVAKNWAELMSNKKGINYSVADVKTAGKGKLVSLYVFSLEPRGFVLVAADDLLRPILGYSYENDFEIKDYMTNVNGWLENYYGEHKYAIENNLKSDFQAEWDDILKLKRNVYFSGREKGVEPLVDIHWDQSYPYNMFCPEDAGGQCVVGCVATAMSHIMYYHEHPRHGEGTSEYTVNLGGVPSQHLEVDHYNATYDYAIMLPSGSGSQATNEAMGLLCYHAGVSVHMMYGSVPYTDGSGAYSQDVPGALINHFDYSNEMVYKKKSYYSASQWKNLLRGDLDEALPVYYSGSGSNGGHAFFTDGYDDNDQFHFNFGWGGSGDGYYPLNGTNAVNGFASGQAAILHIKPNPVHLFLADEFQGIYSTDDEYQVDLNNYFRTGETENDPDYYLEYEVLENSDSEAMEVSIEGSVLTLTRIADTAVSDIKIKIVSKKASNNQEVNHYFLDFEAKMRNNRPVAGHGYTYDFDGETYVNVNQTDLFANMGEFSIDAWIYLANNETNHGIISKASSANSGFYLVVMNNKLRFFVKTQSGKKRKVYGKQILEPGKWYHVAAVNSNSKVETYINGVLDDSKEYTTGPELSDVAEENIKLAYAYGNVLEGALDDVHLWKEALSVTKINQLASGLNADQNNLIAHWGLNEDYGAKVKANTEALDGSLNMVSNRRWQVSTAPYIYNVASLAPANPVEGQLVAHTDGVSFTVAENPSSGTVSVAAGGAFNYTANSEINEDSFLYKVTKNSLESDPVRVYLRKAGTGINEDDEITPEKAVLYQNYPNPFNPTTEIKFYLPALESVSVVVYNIRGEKVATLINNVKLQGVNKVAFDASAFNSGVYYYQLKAGSINLTKKMLLVK